MSQVTMFRSLGGGYNNTSITLKRPLFGGGLNG